MQRVYWVLLGLCLWSSVQAQHRTHESKTYKNVCFYAIEPKGFKAYMKLAWAIEQGNYRAALPAIRKMRRALKRLPSSSSTDPFVMWYANSYRDAETHIERTRKSTFALLKDYERRIRQKDTRYYHHRRFLMDYLAYKTEYFYPKYWFMSIERYFSEAFVLRILRDNKEGELLFTPSVWYKHFEPFEEMLDLEADDIQYYLGIGTYGPDSLGVLKEDVIKYEYKVLRKSSASYLLTEFMLNQVGEDAQVNREMKEFIRYLQAVEAGKVWLVARFNYLNEVPSNDTSRD